MQKSVVLLSAGLDSYANLQLTRLDTEVVLALTFDYGQRAAKKEVAQAKKICRSLKVPHKVVKLDFIKAFGQSSLTSKKQKVPTGKEVSIDDLSTSRRTAASVWVPNRNGIFLNIAAGFAESLKANQIVPGFNIEEAATFPDNTDDFLKAATAAFQFSTANKMKAVCYTTMLNKSEIIQKLKALKENNQIKLKWSDIWPCYFAEKKWCGECESCQRAKRAFNRNNIPSKELLFK